MSKTVIELRPRQRLSSSLGWLVVIGLMTGFAWSPIRSPYDNDQTANTDARHDVLNDATQFLPLNNHSRKEPCSLNLSATCPGSQDPEGYGAALPR